MINEFKYRQTWTIWPSPLYNFTVPLKILNDLRTKKQIKNSLFSISLEAC